MKTNYFLSSLLALSLTSCVTYDKNSAPIDTLITGGTVYIADGTGAKQLDIAVCQQTICGVFPTGSHQYTAITTINASGKIVSPGFIDPHTHTLDELFSTDKNTNLNYLTQGVTTVINGNDGDGPVDISSTAKQLTANGIGTNVALLVGHNNLRRQVMGTENRHATPNEIAMMSSLLSQAMQDGALGDRKSVV